MKTLVLKHNGHEAHVPYELPSGLWFDCFIPGHGIRPAHVDPRSDTITVDYVDGLDEFCSHDAVLEQAGDVCAVFEHALGLSATSHFHRHPEDAKVLSTIAEMALLESDLHTAWCRLPDVMWVPLSSRPMGPDDTRLPSRAALHSFILNVLVPRAQDLATAAAKRREVEWNEEQEELKHLHRHWNEVDLTIDRAKERA